MYKKKLQAVILSTVALGLLGFIIWWSFSQIRNQEKRAAADLYTLIPADCYAVLEIQDINTFEKELNNTCFSQEYKTLHISDLLSTITKRLTRLIHQEAHGLSHDMSQFLISFHKTGASEAQIIYGRLGKNNREIANELASQSRAIQYAPKQFGYKEENITIYPSEKNFTACYIGDGFFAISDQIKLIERVIDAHLAQNGINRERDFERLRREQKSNTPLLLYARTNKPFKGWSRFDIRMNAEAIYATGTHSFFDNDSCKTAFQNIERIESDRLPQHTQWLYQRTFSNKDNTEIGNQTDLLQLLSLYTTHEVSTIVYSPQHKDSRTHQLLISPIKSGKEQELKQALRISAIKRPNHWTSQAAYPIWHFTNDTSVHPYFTHTDETEEYYVSLFQNCILIAPQREGICDYINELTSLPGPDTSTNKALYQHCLNDLAEEANLTIIADMNDVMANDTFSIQETGIPLPFFFKHKDFFKNFMLSTQYIYTNGQQSTNLILTYQGDSILKKRILEE